VGGYGVLQEHLEGHIELRCGSI